MGKAGRRLRRAAGAAERKEKARESKRVRRNPMTVLMVNDGRRFFVQWCSPGVILFTHNADRPVPKDHMEVRVGVQGQSNNLVFKHEDNDDFVIPWGVWKGHVSFVDMDDTAADMQLAQAEEIMRSGNALEAMKRDE